MMGDWADGELEPSLIYLVLCGYLVEVYITYYIPYVCIYRVKSCKQDLYGFGHLISNWGVGAVNLKMKPYTGDFSKI